MSFTALMAAAAALLLLLAMAPTSSNLIHCVQSYAGLGEIVPAPVTFSAGHQCLIH
jgi:hypothetical protein